MDLVRRVRWGNVVRAVAVLGAVGLVVLWPRLRAEGPVVPVRPAVEEPRVVVKRRGGVEPRAPRSEPRRSRPSAEKISETEVRRRPRPQRRAPVPRQPRAPAPRAPVPGQPSAPAPPPPAPPAAGGEFGFE